MRRHSWRTFCIRLHANIHIPQRVASMLRNWIPSTPFHRLCLAPPRRSAAVSELTLRKAEQCGFTLIQHTEGEIVPAFTHFVSGTSLKLTLHSLIALASGRPIVTPEWLEQSASSGVALDASHFLVFDAKVERKNSFSLQSSWQAARKCRLLEGAVPPPAAAANVRLVNCGSQRGSEQGSERASSCVLPGQSRGEARHSVRPRADCAVYVAPALLEAEADRGASIQALVRACLGLRGAVVASLEDLCAPETADSAARQARRRRVILVEQGAPRRLYRSLPPGCEVWHREQFRRALIQQSFAHQKAFMCT